LLHTKSPIGLSPGPGAPSPGLSGLGPQWLPLGPIYSRAGPCFKLLKLPRARPLNIGPRGGHWGPSLLRPGPNWAWAPMAPSGPCIFKGRALVQALKIAQGPGPGPFSGVLLCSSTMVATRQNSLKGPLVSQGALEWLGPSPLKGPGGPESPRAQPRQTSLKRAWAQALGAFMGPQAPGSGLNGLGP